MIKKIKNWWREWKRKRAVKKKLKEMRDQDPYTYD